MRHSKVDVCLHFAWATWHREPLLVDDVQRVVHRSIEAEARRLGCSVLAVGGMPDHVHLVLRLPATVSIAELARRVKGVSSAIARQSVSPSRFFGWQDNYAVMSVSARDSCRVLRYVADQARHHASGDLWPAAEATFAVASEEDAETGSDGTGRAG
jgi:putative transposase